MQKRNYFFNNPTSEHIRIVELNLSMPPGMSDLFVLNEDINYEQIDHSIKNGTLRAAIENGLCYPVPNPDNQRTFSTDVLIRKPIQIQIMAPRTRFSVVVNQDTVVFDSVDDSNLFGEEEVKPARQLEEELKTSIENTEAIEATIKQANLPEKPIKNRYIHPIASTEVAQAKIKNDTTMGYVTCSGINHSNGKSCMRRAKTGKKFCGLHHDQAK